MDHTAFNWLAGAVGLFASMLSAYVLFRSKTAALLKDELGVTRERCKRLEEDNQKLTEDSHIKDLVIADLKAKTDLTDIRQSLKEVLTLSATTAQTLASVAETMKSISLNFNFPATKLS